MPPSLRSAAAAFARPPASLPAAPVSVPRRSAPMFPRTAPCRPRRSAGRPLFPARDSRPDRSSRPNRRTSCRSSAWRAARPRAALPSPRVPAPAQGGCPARPSLPVRRSGQRSESPAAFRFSRSPPPARRSGTPDSRTRAASRSAGRLPRSGSAQCRSKTAPAASGRRPCGHIRPLCKTSSRRGRRGRCGGRCN